MRPDNTTGSHYQANHNTLRALSTEGRESLGFGSISKTGKCHHRHQTYASSEASTGQVGGANATTEKGKD